MKPFTVAKPLQQRRAHATGCHQAVQMRKQDSQWRMAEKMKPFTVAKPLQRAADMPQCSWMQKTDELLPKR